MSNTKTNHGSRVIGTLHNAITNSSRTIQKLFWSNLSLLALTLLLPAAHAQTINFTGTPPILTPNLYVGGGFTGSFTNLQFKSTISAALDPANLVTYTASGAPAGVTITFSGTGTTNTVTNILTVAVANVTPGVYPITITAFTNGIQFGTASTNFNLVVGNVWTNPSKTTVDWNTAGNWSTGVPGAADNVMFQDAGENTNFVSASTTVGSLTYVRNIGSSNIFTTIANGATLAIAGANGFSLNEDTQSPLINKGMNVRISGGGGASFVVTNQNANYSVNGASTGASGANSGTILTMTNLDNQFVNVSRIGFGDATLADRGSVGAQMVFVELAKTNVFISSYSNSFTGPDFTNSIQFSHQFDIGNSGYSSGNAMTLSLGISNAFLADSFRAGGNASQGLGSVRFAPAFTNSATVPIAYFRSTNGGRMSFVGLGVGSGLHNGNRFSRAQLFLEKGILDMKVDTMWLGVNRTNDSSVGAGNPQTGTLIYGATADPTKPSIVDVNTLIVGNQLYTNNAYGVGRITVQTNAILVVNNVMELGHTTGDTNGGATVVLGNGQVTINGGLARVNQVTVGAQSADNRIILGAGGHLIVSNTIASPAKALSTLSVNGSKLTFHVTAGATNAYVTNLTTGATISTINIASLTGFSPTVPATNVVIKYDDAAASHNVAIGTIPAGFNNISLVDNLVDRTIEIRIQTNAPATLRWRGGENSNWDHTSLNWQNTATLATTRFFDGDSVIFDNSAVVPLTVNVTETINPGQVGTGILVSNTTSAFTFAALGGSIGNCSLVKTGASTIQIDCPTTATVTVNQGALTGGSSGAVGGTTIASGASMNFGGAINGALQVSGAATLAAGGTINNSFTVQASAVFTNNGTVQGASLTLGTNAVLHNLSGGLLLNIGAATTGTNSLVFNEGNIGAAAQTNSLTVNGTFKDTGVGIIYLSALTMNGGSTFLPGGDGIGTTAILSPGVPSGGFPGRVTLLTGSTTLIKVDFANPQTNTIVKSQFQDFGPNSNTKNFNGCTILVTNINTGAGVFATGQTFRMFMNSDSGILSGNIGNEGLNTTNTYPIIQPVFPLANAKWDLTNLRDTDPNGFVNLISFPTTGTNITHNTFVADGTNRVSHLQWPSSYIGWSLQQQTNALSIGITTNWTTVVGSSATNEVYVTNSISTPTAFFRMIYP